MLGRSGKVRVLLLGALVLAMSVALSLVWTVLLGARSGKVILENCQGDFCLRVAEGSYHRGLFSSEQRYEVWITRRGSPDYGYVLHHSFAWNDWDTNVTIRACKIEWSTLGVTLLEPTGQSVFVPRKFYEQGR
jgi:hypothetical protein